MATEITIQNKISELVETNPEATDPVSKGDDHLRMIKRVLKSSFPSDIQVHIPNTEGQDNKFLVVDGTDPKWEDPIDWRDTIGMSGSLMRSKFSYVGPNTIRVWPGSYDVAGAGTVNLDWTAADSPIDISLSDSAEGWNYIYIDQSEVSSAISASPYARMSITEETSVDLLGHSNTRPVYNPMKRGFYINEEDRVIFAYRFDDALVKFYHDGGSYVHWDVGQNFATKSSDGWQTFTSPHIPPLGDYVNAQITFRLGTAENTNTRISHFHARTTGTDGYHILGTIEHGRDVDDNAWNTCPLKLPARSALTGAEIDIYKSGGSSINFCEADVNGFYLPNGI
ncbi:MAG: hypothetical protein VW443_09690 [Pseudomonadales bacterium]